jgi:hypothetical protein
VVVLVLMLLEEKGLRRGRAKIMRQAVEAGEVTSNPSELTHTDATRCNVSIPYTHYQKSKEPLQI